jgi:cytochrome c oxidase subunit II
VKPALAAASVMRALGLLALGGALACKPPAGAHAPLPLLDAPGAPVVIHVEARRFAYEPSRLVLKKGVPVVFEFTSADRKHGFKVPELGLRADIEPGKTTRLAYTPDRAGTFAFACDVFCGDGHEDMTGELVVSP